MQFKIIAYCLSGY